MLVICCEICVYKATSFYLILISNLIPQVVTRFVPTFYIVSFCIFKYVYLHFLDTSYFKVTKLRIIIFKINTILKEKMILNLLMKEFCINLIIYRSIWYNFQGKSRRESCNVMLHVPKQFSWYETKPRFVLNNKLHEEIFWSPDIPSHFSNRTQDVKYWFHYE